MNIPRRYIGIIALTVICLGWKGDDNPWGFFGHKRINRMAVFTLPPEMIAFYKKHIEFITEHAVDPDKRRYANRFEGPRHYLDLDRYGKPPFEALPRDWTGALAKFTAIAFLNQRGDTVVLSSPAHALWEKRKVILTHPSLRRWTRKDSIEIPQVAYRDFVYRNVVRRYYEPEWKIEGDSLTQLLRSVGLEVTCGPGWAVDSLSAHGTLPYNLERVMDQLTEAFRSKNTKRILQLSADIGHYIADAHVPLHTTENYNGQLTNQVGIHAFWESRIPELFADAEYDFFVGKAAYIDQTAPYFWKIVMDSHQLVDSVLLIEQHLRDIIPPDHQMCYDTRMEMTVLTQCKDFAKTYSDRLDGMVESRMRASILSVGSIWYTAWINAGQPNLGNLNEIVFTPEERKEQEEEEALYRSGKINGRPHDN